MRTLSERMAGRKFTIYAIKCKKNNKIYIGLSCDFEQRMYSHFCTLNNGKHTNEQLQKDYNRYGEESFEIYIIEEDLPFERCRETEQAYICEYRTRDSKYGYNTRHHRVQPNVRVINGKPDKEPTHGRAS